MPVPALLGLLGLASGATKHFASDLPAERESRALRASEQRFSPFTGQAVQTQVRRADPVAPLLQGAFAGAQLGQNVENQALQNDILKSQNAFLQSVTPVARPTPFTGVGKPIAVDPRLSRFPNIQIASTASPFVGAYA